MVPEKLKRLCQDLRGSVGDCSFLRLVHNSACEESAAPSCGASSCSSEPDEIVGDDFRILVGCEVEVVGEDSPAAVKNLVEQRQKKLYDAVDVMFVNDDAVVDGKILEEGKWTCCRQVSVKILNKTQQTSQTTTFGWHTMSGG